MQNSCFNLSEKKMKLILLDRDGVINEDSDNYIKSVDEFLPIKGSIEAIAKLNKAGYKIAVVTNQSGIGRGLFTLDELDSMHNYLNSLVKKAGGKISTIVWCPHTPKDKCKCRKPEIGLIDKVKENLNISVKNSWFVGDTLKDIQAAFAAKCKPVLVLTGKGQKTFDKLQCSNLEQIAVFDNLADFANNLLKEF